MVNNPVVRIFGQGYVGLPLAVSAAQVNFRVQGIDTNKEVVKNLNLGNSHINDVSNEVLSTIIKNGNYLATNTILSEIGTSINIVCVPTPLSQGGEPDPSNVIKVITYISKFLSKGDLVIIESTIAPGMTRDIILPILEKNSGLKIDQFYLAFSPERIDPLNLTWTLSNTPKLISGLTPKSLDTAIEFYSRFVQRIVACTSIEVAETAKLLENSFRLINISFMNEMSKFCNKLGISINEVIDAASTKPYGFMPFYPSLGVGGHCIPVDPVYLSKKAKEAGTPITMIDRAYEINSEMHEYFVGRAVEKIGGVKGKKIMVLGLAYKPNISDTRESPVEPLIKLLRSHGAIVEWHDDLVGEWNGEKSLALGANYDLAILATPHDYFDLSKLGNVPILNTRGSL